MARPIGTAPLIERWLTGAEDAGQGPFAQLEWSTRQVSLRGQGGQPVLDEQIEAPSDWSDAAVATVASRYLGLGEDRHHCRLHLLRLVLRVLGVAPPRCLDERCGNASFIFCPATLDDMIEIVLVSEVVLPGDLHARSRPPRALSVEVEVVLIAKRLEWRDERALKRLTDDLAEPMTGSESQ